MATADAAPRPGDDIPPAGRAIEAAILFADLVSSSEFASVMSLQEYAEYVASFQATCARQCEYFFKTHNAKLYRPGDYRFSVVGDELAVFIHSGNDADDVYQLICLAQALKCSWLGSSVNAARVAQGAPSVELAIGIHAGLLWAMPGDAEGPVLRGFVINVAKRIETSSREGQHFRIMISGAAFKRVNRRIRILLIGLKDVAKMKGIVTSVAIHEVIDSFIDPTDRMFPEARDAFSRVAHGAMKCNSFDVWIHSCYQLIEGRRHGQVTDENMDLCRGVLNMEPANAVALYYAAEGLIEREEHAMALLYLTDLTHRWPTFTDGWLELARTAVKIGEPKVAAHAVRQARRHGAKDSEQPLCLP